MLSITLVCVGTLKEPYLREALAEYQKRLSAYCRFTVTELKESPLPDKPAAADIDRALSAEAERILAAMPPRAYKVALCVEGKARTSEQMAELIANAANQGYSELAFLIGSSHGLHERVKAACDLRLSVSQMTFPHQLMRVLMGEILYRSLAILHGSPYHK